MELPTKSPDKTLRKRSNNNKELCNKIGTIKSPALKLKLEHWQLNLIYKSK